MNHKRKVVAGFGWRLREARLARGMTQQAVADRILVDRTTYTKYELGKAEPHIDGFIELCKVLEVTPDQLLGWEESPTSQAP